MNNNTKKLFQAGLMMLIVMCSYRSMSQSMMSAVVVVDTPSDNIFMVMYKQVVSIPASLLHILIMCIVAWLIDETTWINSRYIPHITILFGASTYWLYAGSATVAQCYPFPGVVLASNGMISGLFAYAGHRQIIARIICFTRQRTGNTESLTKPNQQNP
jgi:hypothetical protein